MINARGDNSLKTPLNQSLHRFAEQKVQAALWSQGKALPAAVSKVGANGATVTINFEVNGNPFTLPQVTVPVVGSTYVRLPVQVGDLGMVIPADARLGGVSGLGKGTPNLGEPLGNLQGLAFLWLGSTNWTAPLDLNAVDINGPNGAILRNTVGNAANLTLNATNIVATYNVSAFWTLSGSQAQLAYGSNNVTVTSGGVAITSPSGTMSATSGGLQFGGNVGFFATSPVSKQTVTGQLSAVTDTRAKAVLTSIISALVNYGLATNGTT